MDGRKENRFRTMLLAATAGLIALGGGISAAVAADSVVTGFGNEVPLSFAVRQIVPPGHEISYGAGVDVNAVVTWSGGRPWGEVLNQVAYGRGLAVRRHADTVRLTVVPPVARTDEPGPHAVGGGGFSIVPYRGPLEVTAPSATEHVDAGDPISLLPDTYEGALPQEEADPEGGLMEALEEGLIVEELPPPPPTWSVTAGISLRGALEDWTERAGWTLIWESEYEYPLAAGASFQGEFVDVASELVASMGQARPMVTAKFYQGNRVLVIGNASLDSVN